MALATSTAYRLTCDGHYCRAETSITRSRAGAIAAAIGDSWRVEDLGGGKLLALCLRCRGDRGAGVFLAARTRAAKAVA